MTWLTSRVGSAWTVMLEYLPLGRLQINRWPQESGALLNYVPARASGASYGRLAKPCEVSLHLQFDRWCHLVGTMCWAMPGIPYSSRVYRMLLL